MVLELKQAQEHEQWQELKSDIRSRIVSDHQKLEEEMAAKQRQTELLKSMPCLLCS